MKSSFVRSFSRGLIAVICASTMTLSNMPLASAASNTVGSASTQSVYKSSYVLRNNWSGYVATGSTFNTVTGTFNMPKSVCTASGAYNLFWVGFDGFSDPSQSHYTVEQIGIGTQCVGTTPHYFAWWQMWAENSGEIMHPITGFTVNPNNVIKATVTYDGVHKGYILQLHNNSTGQPFTTERYCAGGYYCTRQSADWIAERYMKSINTFTPLAKWYPDASLFSSDYASSVTNASLSPISHFHNTEIDMIGKAGYLAITTPLKGNGSTFQDSWYGAQ